MTTTIGQRDLKVRLSQRGDIKLLSYWKMTKVRYLAWSVYEIRTTIIYCFILDTNTNLLLVCLGSINT